MPADGEGPFEAELDAACREFFLGMIGGVPTASQPKGFQRPLRCLCGHEANANPDKPDQCVFLCEKCKRTWIVTVGENDDRQFYSTYFEVEE